MLAGYAPGYTNSANHLKNLVTKFGNEISSLDSSAAAEQRERRGLVPGLVSRLIYQIILYCAKLVTLI